MILSCNFSRLPPKVNYSSFPRTSFSPPKSLVVSSAESNHSPRFSKILPFLINRKKGHLQICRSSFDTQTPQDPSLVSSSSEENELLADGGTGGDGGGEERDWTTSFLLFAFWAGLMYYVFFLAPDQTPLKKQNSGLAICYSVIFWGAYALIPYFVLWKPPAPPVEESELKRWPLNFLESKLTAAITMAAGLAIMVYAFSSGGDLWKEFFQYFKGSKFIHIMTIDFGLLSTFAPFWVYNDMTARKWDGKGSWLLPLSLIPFVGPVLYLLLRPSLSAAPIALAPSSDET
ncbi:UNVERIFIED_CONTAM: hypothetical protein Sradi_6142400 [Sesamum radiatum]|uniref:Cardiolipin synthase N-terminal domain-containing protein n=1 Tax=Sesamum radiatum TaxID=300843 RepID=A0AAW2KM35_SESRA